MFIILKPDADLSIWLPRLINFDLKTYKRHKNETWVRQFYSHIPKEALQRNIDFFINGRCVGIDLDIPFDIKIAKWLRDHRVIDPRFLHRNQIHVPDSQVHNNVGRELFLDEISNR